MRQRAGAWPPRRTVTRAGVVARQPAAVGLARCGAAVAARSASSWLASGAAADAVDGDELVARAQDAGAGVAGVTWSTPVVRRRTAREREQRPEDHERDQQVHRGPGGDHDDPLPHRLAVVGAVGDLRRELLVAGSSR